LFHRHFVDTVGGFHKFFERRTSMDRYFIMEIVQQQGGYFLDEYLYHVWARPESDHRSIDLQDEGALKKLVTEDIYLQLKEQRKKTGTDWLKEGKMKELLSYEQSLLGDKSYLADKIRTFACIQIDHKKFGPAFQLLKKSLLKAPLMPANYRTILYFLRAYIGLS
jgi:hypothetical protein